MGDGSLALLRFAVALTLALAFGLPVQALLGVGRYRRRTALLCAGVGLVLSAIGLLALGAAMAGTGLLPVDPALLAMIVGETPPGRSFVVRFVALGLALAVAARAGPVGTGRLATIAAATGVALATLAWTGHGAMDEGARGWVHLLADIVHLLAAGAWIGAIAALLAAVAGRDAAPRAVGAALASFATTGSVLVGSIAFSGAINGWMILGSAGVAGIFDSLYGRLLLAKLALFAAMLAIAATNRWLLTPRLMRTIAGGGGQVALRRLRTSLLAELGCGIAILAIVAWLGMLAPDG